MASNWYVSSVGYTAVVQWAALTTLAVGAIRRQLATPAANAERCFRVSAITTGITGAAEPTWTLTSNGTTTDAGVTWTECTAQEAHQHDNGVSNTWTAPAAVFGNIDTTGKNVVVAGDTVYASSDHTQAHTATVNQFTVGTNALPINIISVSKAGSVPPVAADVLQGAQWTITSGNSAMRFGGALYINGLNLTNNGSNAIVPFFNSGNPIRLVNSTITLGGTGTFGPSAGSLTLENVAFVFNNGLASGISMSAASTLIWKDSASAISGSSKPTTQLLIFPSGIANPAIVGIDGVDLSGAPSSLLLSNANAGSNNRINLANCKLWTTYNLGGLTSTSDSPEIEAVNVGTGATNYICERHMSQGDLTTDTSTTLASGGAWDGVTTWSHKIVTTARAQKLIYPFKSFSFLKQNQSLSSVTVTVEFVSSAAMNNDDVWLEVQYFSASGSPLGAVVSSYPATPLTTAAALTTSTATWNNPPATPSYQKIALAIVAAQAGWFRGRVFVGKASKTFWMNPRFT